MAESTQMTRRKTERHHRTLRRTSRHLASDDRASGQQSKMALHGPSLANTPRTGALFWLLGSSGSYFFVSQWSMTDS